MGRASGLKALLHKIVIHPGCPQSETVSVKSQTRLFYAKLAITTEQGSVPLWPWNKIGFPANFAKKAFGLSPKLRQNSNMDKKRIRYVAHNLNLPHLPPRESIWNILLAKRLLYKRQVWDIERYQIFFSFLIHAYFSYMMLLRFLCKKFQASTRNVENGASVFPPWARPPMSLMGA